MVCGQVVWSLLSVEVSVMALASWGEIILSARETRRQVERERFARRMAVAVAAVVREEVAR